MNSPRTPSSLLAALFIAAAVPMAMVACTTTTTGKHETAGEYIDDATVTARVKAALAQDPQVRVTQVNVETYKGVVQLSGFVDSSANAARAVEVTRGVSGVRSVKNDIVVKSAAR
jgi:osmotically-inducible protein OsmY